MTVDKVDYKELASDLLWHLFISTNNGDSGYAVITEDGPDKGRLIPNPDFSSVTLPNYTKLKYNELGIVLDIDTERYVPDGHHCKSCPVYNECTANFKDDPKQLQCNYWYTMVDGSVKECNILKMKDSLLTTPPRVTIENESVFDYLDSIKDNYSAWRYAFDLAKKYHDNGKNPDEHLGEIKKQVEAAK